MRLKGGESVVMVTEREGKECGQGNAWQKKGKVWKPKQDSVKSDKRLDVVINMTNIHTYTYMDVGTHSYAQLRHLST